MLYSVHLVCFPVRCLDQIETLPAAARNFLSCNSQVRLLQRLIAFLRQKKLPNIVLGFPTGLLHCCWLQLSRTFCATSVADLFLTNSCVSFRLYSCYVDIVEFFDSGLVSPHLLDEWFGSLCVDRFLQRFFFVFHRIQLCCCCKTSSVLFRASNVEDYFNRTRMIS